MYYRNKLLVAVVLVIGGTFLGFVKEARRDYMAWKEKRRKQRENPLS
jgi:hypothetical protein